MKIILYLFISIMIFQCNSQSPDKLWKNAELMRIENKIEKTVNNLELIIKKYPNHDLSAKAQFLKAEIYLNDLKEYDFSIEEFKLVIDLYPNHEVAKNSLFMIAYIYNNYLNSYTDAIDTYNLFVNKYPNDELIPSVKYELNGLTKYNKTIDSLNSIVSKTKYQ